MALSLCSFSVFASNLTNPGPMIFRGADLYVAAWTFSTDVIEIVKFTATGVRSVFATIHAAGSAAPNSAFPTDLAFDSSGNLYVAGGDNNPGKYWTVTPGGAVSAVSSGTSRGPSSIEFDSPDNLYVTDAYTDTILKNGASFAGPSGDLGFANGLLWSESTLYALQIGAIQEVSRKGGFSEVALLGVDTASFALQPGTREFYFFNTGGSPDLIAKVRPGESPMDLCSLGFDDNLISVDLEFGPDGALYISDGPNGRILRLVVPTPAQGIQDLVDEINGLSIPQSVKNSLGAKLDSALNSLENGATSAAKGQLQAFINEVNAKCCIPHPGKTLTQAEADALLAAAEDLLASLP